MQTLEQRTSQTRVPLDYASHSNISWGGCANTESRWLLKVDFTVKTMKLYAFWGCFLKKVINADERVLKNGKLLQNNIWKKKKSFWYLPSEIHTSRCVLSPCSQNLAISWYCRLLYRCRHLLTWPYNLRMERGTVLILKSLSVLRKNIRACL